MSSFNINNYTPCRGDIEGQSFLTTSESISQTYSAVQFSPHALTHMDLPNCLDRHELEISEGYEGVEPLSKSPEIISQMLDSYSKIKILDTIILDVSYKVNIIKNYIDKKTGCLFQNIEQPHFDSMMEQLEIKKGEDISNKLSKDELENKFIIFKTLWDEEFNRFSNSLTNPYFELRHPYLIYPFLSYNTIKWLVRDVKITGIGCETCGIDNPGYYSKHQFLPECAKNYYDSMTPSFRPVSVLLLTNKLQYINHVVNLDKIIKSVSFGKLLVIPVSLGNIDVQLVKLLFLEEE